MDDSPFIVDAFVTMLERGGYRTLAAYGGGECLALLKTVTPDLILLDIMMAPIDGWETLEQIKQDPGTKEIPVIMLTARQLTPEKAREYSIYVEDYLVKPVTLRELTGAIEHVLRRRRTIKSTVEIAQQSGFDAGIITEYARLMRSIDVNRRFKRILETAASPDAPPRDAEGLAREIQRMEVQIELDEKRFRQIQADLPGVPS